MSLLTIVQNALEESGKFESLSTIVGNSNETAQRSLRLANREGYLLSRRGLWQELLKEHIFTTTATMDNYALPADFDRFVNMTQWDRTNFWRMIGPVTPNQWQVLQSAIISSGVRRRFRLQGNRIFLDPVPPTTGDTIAFEYMSSYWVDTDADGTGDSTVWVNDSDTSLLDEELITMGLIWRFRRINGLSYQEDFNMYERETEKALARKGAPVLNLAHGMQLVPDIVQEGDFG